MTWLQQILRLLSAIILLTAAGAKDNIHCPLWKTKCENYEQKNCNRGNQGKPWTSCCIPPDDTEGSGDSDMTAYPSKIYTIQTGAFSKSEAWCDMDTAGGGWLTILRRSKTYENITFKRYRDDYLDGFGDLKKDFWLGLRTMNIVTKNQDYEMRVDLYNSADENVAHIKYDTFKVHQHPNYTLELSGFLPSDTKLTDSLEQFNGQTWIVKESSSDTDNASVCAAGRAGWWYTDGTCFTQGAVLTDETNRLEWFERDSSGMIKGQSYHKFEMKIRPKNCISTTAHEDR